MHQTLTLTDERVDDDDLYEDVPLDELTIPELESDLREARQAINEISVQLDDELRIKQLGDDYLVWRRRAKWARLMRQRDVRDIKAVLHKKQIERRDELGEQRRALHKEEKRKANEQYQAVVLAAAAEKRAKIAARIEQAGGTDGLLLRMYAAFHQFKGDGDWPDDFPLCARDAIGLTSAYLKQQYGSMAVVRFIKESSPLPPT